MARLIAPLAVFSREKIKKLLFGFTGEFDSMKTRVGGVVGGFKEIFQGNLEKGFATIKGSFTTFFSSAQMASHGSLQAL